MKYKFKQTCPACPEQYTVWDGNIRVAYVRYRWGYLRVNPFTNDEIDFDTIICDMTIGDSLDGELPSQMRNKILETVDKEIEKYYDRTE